MIEYLIDKWCDFLDYLIGVNPSDYDDDDDDYGDMVPV